MHSKFKLLIYLNSRTTSTLFDLSSYESIFTYLISFIEYSF